MRVRVVAPPEPVISLDELDRHLRLDGDEDAILQAVAYRDAATAHIDGPDGWLGRAIGRQTLEARIDNWECGSIRLPCPPVQSVSSVRYLDRDGAEQAVDPASYELLGDSIMPVWGASWPVPRWQREAIRILYVAGYAEVPAPIRAAILLMTGDLWRHRGTVEVGATSVAVPMSVPPDALLGTYRVYC